MTCGRAHWSRRSAVGFRRTAARCPRRPSFLLVRRGKPTWRVSLRRMAASLPTSRMLWSTQGGYAPEEARRAARRLLADVLSYDPTRPASFPSNGRTLTDDAADALL